MEIEQSVLDYKKYYNLEKYLFEEVNPKFHCNKCLDSFDFFSIIIWKSSRQKTNIFKSLIKKNQDADSCINKFTKELYKVEDFDKFEMLMNIKGINVAMASGILTVLYPEKFTVYDFRVCQIIEGFENLQTISNRKKQFQKYIEFVENIRKLDLTCSLREIDQMLWGKSFYDELVKDLKSDFSRLDET